MLRQQSFESEVDIRRIFSKQELIRNEKLPTEMNKDRLYSVIQGLCLVVPECRYWHMHMNEHKAFMVID